MSAATGPTVEILPGIDALPAGTWDELAPPHDPMWGREVFAAMEHGAIGPDGYAYAVVREAGRTVAVLPLAAVRGLRLDQVVGERERRLLAPVRRLCPGLLRVPMLFCGNFLGQGHVLSREPLPGPVAALLVRTVLDHARRHRLGTVVLKDFAPGELATLRPALEAAGFFQVPSMPDTELALGYDSFDAYVAALPAKARRNVRSKLRKFHARGDLRIEVLADFAGLVPAMLGLYRQVMDRADQTLDVLDASFLRALHRPGGPDQRLVACFEGDRLVAYLLCLFRGEGAIGARIGLDYRLAHEAHLYHHVHYAAIELAIGRGCRHIRFAQTAYEPKRELGCALVEQRYALTHVRPLPRAVLRRLLPRALETALARTLAPRS
ncbi:GNAT family N-acetyltransferase [Streptomyces sp. NPDC059080]|uniref:GNAT family N-acetyltransferase n=1 Tax=Streptomyces sp. NPDC059080 TaxID=3346718 RepID=UPI003696E369